MTVTATTETFNTVIADNVTIVDFWATWCGPCRQFSPVFEASAERWPDVTFATVDIETSPELVRDLNIQSVPTVMVFRNGEHIWTGSGVMTGAQIDTVLAGITNTSR